MGRLTRIALLSALLYISSMVWSFFTQQVFTQPALMLSFSKEAAWLMLYFSLSMLLVGVFASAVALLIKPLSLAFAVEAITALFLLLTFPKDLFPLSISLAVSYFVALFVFTVMIEIEMKNYVSFSLRHVVGPHLDFLFLILTIIVSVLFFVHFRFFIETKEFELPKKIIRPIAQTMTENFIEKSGQSTQAELFQKIEKSGLLEQLGIALPKAIPDPGTTIEDIAEGITTGVATQMKAILSPYIRYIPLMTTTVLFFALQEVKMIISWFTVPALALFFKGLEVMHFAHYEYKMEKVKRLVLDA